MKIAISGKGGVGKTTLMALLAGEFKKAGKEVLVIDADPSPHMAQTLGVKHPEAIRPIAEMTKLLVERSGKTEGSPMYNMNPQVNDLLEEFMIDHNGMKLMVLGAIQTGDKGCACPENNVLRRMLTKLLLSKNQVVLLDMEAGVEHLGRGTIAGIDHLLIVVIPSKSSIRTALKVKKLAEDVKIPKISFVGNLVTDEEDRSFLEAGLGVQPIAFFPDSQTIRNAERQDVPVTSLENAAGEAPGILMQALEGKKAEG
ncbi:MAG: AAA family ATPase [Proteobacteria bacterium]|nr:AAA family ATPase [Pseudomonadota bacterium]MBU1420417.1 AAA family ATPase [Pseudomonadota bacterium]MBU1456380.1 AAA family ATPase [Pseudomonadota bacterium]